MSEEGKTVEVVLKFDPATGVNIDTELTPIELMTFLANVSSIVGQELVGMMRQQKAPKIVKPSMDAMAAAARGEMK